MSKTWIPADYKPLLSLGETQKAIALVKSVFTANLESALNLTRVSAPLFVDPSTGLNDDLNGVERPVAFDILETGEQAQIVHSLAKWKRWALGRYGFKPGEGLWTDMNAVRRDEEMDNLHSIYVDQWDWEAILPKGRRDVEYFQEIVRKIVNAICDTEKKLHEKFPQLPASLSPEVSFVTTQQLEDLYPDKTPKERENLYLKDHPTACVMQIGGKLASGIKHDGRAPDYDDWSLNGDILFWNDVLGCAFEVSSMGIRVDADAMERQLAEAGCTERKAFPFHQMVLSGELPLTIGGGIGQSRLSMLLLKKAHIGEVQVSLWDPKTKAVCQTAGVALL